MNNNLYFHTLFFYQNSVKTILMVTRLYYIIYIQEGIKSMKYLNDISEFVKENIVLAYLLLQTIILYKFGLK